MTHYYEETLKICRKYLTSGAKRFLDRQISSHLNKEPERLDPTDREELAKWCRISGSLLLGKAKAEQLAGDVLSARGA